VNVEPLFLSIFNEQKDGWQVAGGDYKVMVGGSSKALPLTGTVKLAGN
jgi:methenyltetrahydromethanopterin cyclohydrolase